MKNLTSILALALISSALATVAPNMALAGESSSTQAASSIANMMSHFREFKRDAPIDASDDSDIIMDCYDQVFLEWSDAYLAVLSKTTDLDPSQIGDLRDFGILYYQSKDDTPKFDVFRKGIGNAVNTAFANVLKSSNTPVLDPSQITIADISGSLYLKTLALCESPDFMTAAAQGLAKADGSKVNPSNYTPSQYMTIWTCNPQGGLSLTRLDGTESGAMPSNACASSGGLSGVNAGIVSGITNPTLPLDAVVRPVRPTDYQSFLNNLRNE